MTREATSVEMQQKSLLLSADTLRPPIRPDMGGATGRNCGLRESCCPPPPCAPINSLKEACEISFALFSFRYSRENLVSISLLGDRSCLYQILTSLRFASTEERATRSSKPTKCGWDHLFGGIFSFILILFSKEISRTG